eukprot:TRINITY_DN49923_c0_g1_i1.p1 TRINITY_DN49923_c0_g1~~TRINITY_DN49923_c0_g1_i1.p1  ORF type:complete len:198 (+),score=17.50 TRINITY_DN49923_c0_g1_i1:382-975(+)
MHIKIKHLLFILIFAHGLVPIPGDNCLFPSPSLAQQSKQHEYLLKSVFMERFTHFVQWPEPFSEKNKDQHFIIGVIGPNPFGDILNTVFSRHTIKGKPVDIRLLNTPADIAKCNMLFIGKTDSQSLSNILHYARKFPVLTISDTKAYANKGVHINMYVENKQIRFEINNNSALASKLNISYLLLKLARIVETTGDKS